MENFMNILEALKNEFKLRDFQVENTVKLIDDGNTIPFIARYRKEAHGSMDDQLILKNRLKEIRAEKKLSQTDLAEMVGVSRNTISSIETGQFNPTAKLALILCIALNKKFEKLFNIR